MLKNLTKRTESDAERNARVDRNVHDVNEYVERMVNEEEADVVDVKQMTGITSQLRLHLIAMLQAPNHPVTGHDMTKLLELTQALTNVTRRLRADIKENDEALKDHDVKIAGLLTTVERNVVQKIEPMQTEVSKLRKERDLDSRRIETLESSRNVDEERQNMLEKRLAEIEEPLRTRVDSLTTNVSGF